MKRTVAVLCLLIVASVGAPPAAALSSPNSSSEDLDITFKDSNDNIKFVDASGNVVDTGADGADIGGAADMDGDGDLDIVFRDSNSNIKFVDASGNVVDTGAAAEGQLGGVGDIDGDGDLDIAFKDSNGNVKFVDASGNVGNAGAATGQVGGVGDIDGDGDLDIAFKDGFDVKFVDASGNVGNTGDSASQVGGVADIDGDGDLDIVTRSGGNVNYVDATGNAVNTGVSATLVGGVGDMNNDGELEIAFAPSNGDVKFTDDSGNVVNTGANAAVEFGSLTAVADIDGDGFFTAAPTVDNSSATPAGSTTSADPVTLSIPVSDSEFSRGDSVDVTFYLNGDNVTTKTISSNQTLSADVTAQDGTNTWFIEATDSAGNTQNSSTFSFTGDYAAPQITAFDPADGSSITTYDGDISADIEDAEFAGDEVQVTATDGSGAQIGQQTISSNGTVTFSYSALAGSNDITWTASDEHGLSTTRVLTFSTPADIEIRNASAPSQLITGQSNEVTVRFFGDDDVIVQKNTTDGTISLSGLPATPEDGYEVTVTDGDDYESRVVVIGSLFDQQRVYLLPTNTTSTTVEFQLTDRTGRFVTPRLTVERPITRDFDGDSTKETRYKNAIAQRFSAAQTLTTTLEQDVRYRLRIRNDEGEERVLGSYTPRTDTDVIDLTIARVELAPGEQEAGYAANAGIVEQDGKRLLRFLYQDPSNSTSSLDYEVKRVDTDPNQTIATDSASNLGRTVATFNVTNQPDNASYAVAFNGTRNGQSVSGVVRAGKIAPWQQGLSDLVASLLGWVSLVAVTGLVVIRSPRVAAVVAVMLATAFSTLGFINVGPVPLGIAGATAVLFVVSRGAGQ